VARAQVRCDLGRLEEARSAAEAALSGTEQMAGAYDEGDWTIARAAVSALESAGGAAPERMLAAVGRGAPPERVSPPRSVHRRPADDADESRGHHERAAQISAQA
jgi:hypothetical protein